MDEYIVEVKRQEDASMTGPSRPRRPGPPRDATSGSAQLVCASISNGTRLQGEKRKEMVGGASEEAARTLPARHFEGGGGLCSLKRK